MNSNTIPSITPQEIAILRAAMLQLETETQSHTNLRAIVVPSSHKRATDSHVPIVVGNRGTGKSTWASILTSEERRNIAQEEASDLNLLSIESAYGFFEGASKEPNISLRLPSRDFLKNLHDNKGLLIWEAVLYDRLTRLVTVSGAPHLTNWEDLIDWIQSNRSLYEDHLIAINEDLKKRKKTFVLVFDALDRLAYDWKAIDKITKNIIRLSIDCLEWSHIRTKVFFRPEHYKRIRSFSGIPDFSKLNYVSLDWTIDALYYLFFKTIKTIDPSIPFDVHPDRLEDNFRRLAGDFMGNNHRKGKTYTWVYNHLADGSSQVSPRSFLIALQEAARHPSSKANQVIDPTGLHLGVSRASERRMTELGEDYPNIKIPLERLEGLRVPADRSDFLTRFKEIREIDLDAGNSEAPTLPIDPKNIGESILNLFEEIGIVARRIDSRIDVPDLYRLEGRIKRMGGIKPPKRGGLL
jgi:hypothetical protein